MTKRPLYYINKYKEFSAVAQANDDNQIMISFRLSADAVERIDARATEAGMSRSEYLRARAESLPEDSITSDVEALLRHLIYMESRTHIALYSIHEMADTLPTAELKKIYDHAITESNKYMVALPDLMIRDRARIAAQAASATAAANGNPSETTGQQLRRCSDPVHLRLFGENQCFICHVPIEVRH